MLKAEFYKICNNILKNWNIDIFRSNRIASEATKSSHKSVDEIVSLQCLKYRNNS
ncbi:unnamed protein product, partial [Larinioides sclopetarius]